MRNTLLMLAVAAALSAIAAQSLTDTANPPSERAASGDPARAGIAATRSPLPSAGVFKAVGDRRVNDPALDTVQTFAGTRPFVHASHSDASIAAHGQHVVAMFGTSGAAVAQGADGNLAFQRNLQVGYAYSRNGGRTWHSGYLPALSAVLPWTGGSGVGSFGYGVVDVDRRGHFHAASLQLADGRWTIAANTSVDGGRTFSPARLIDAPVTNVQNARIAIGPDPAQRTRDNVYVTWGDFTFAPTGLRSVLRLARSTDGGATFAVSTIFAPPLAPDPNHPQNQIDYSMPVVDRATGKLYVAVVNYGFVNDDYLRILVSEDGGETFSLLDFDRPGAPDPQALPIVQPGTLAECGATPDGQGGFGVNFQLVLHAGADAGGSASGLPRYAQSSRLVTQPVLAVSKGVLHLAWSNSTSAVFGDPASGASILYTRSLDDGGTWSEPVAVNVDDTPSQRSVVPAIAIGRFQIETALPYLPSPKDVHISYYTQRADGSLVMSLARSGNRGASFPAARIQRLSSAAFELPPSNVPLPAATNPYQTTHFNRSRFRCLALGDITGLAVGNGRLHAAWTDTRNTLTQPISAFDPISGQPHPKEDVYYASPLIR